MAEIVIFIMGLGVGYLISKPAARAELEAEAHEEFERIVAALEKHEKKD